MYHTTAHGLEKWSCHMFEHLGWMVLAKRDKRGYKLECYKKSLKHLISAIEERIGMTESADRILDLKELHLNAMTLMEFVKSAL